MVHRFCTFDSALFFSENNALKLNAFFYDKYPPACYIQNFMMLFIFYGFICIYCPPQKTSIASHLEF